MTSAIRNAVQQLTTNNDNKITLSLSTYTEKNNDSETNRITRNLLFILKIIIVITKSNIIITKIIYIRVLKLMNKKSLKRISTTLQYNLQPC